MPAKSSVGGIRLAIAFAKATFGNIFFNSETLSFKRKNGKKSTAAD